MSLILSTQIGIIVSPFTSKAVRPSWDPIQWIERSSVRVSQVYAPQMLSLKSAKQLPKMAKALLFCFHPVPFLLCIACRLSTQFCTQYPHSSFHAIHITLFGLSAELCSCYPHSSVHAIHTALYTLSTQLCTHYPHSSVHAIHTALFTLSTLLCSGYPHSSVKAIHTALFTLEGGNWGIKFSFLILPVKQQATVRLQGWKEPSF
jgi:hypothetical protein